MKNLLSTIMFLTYSAINFGQSQVSTVSRYYKDVEMLKEVKKVSKAKYKFEHTYYKANCYDNRLVQIENNIVLWNKTYVRGLPAETWYTRDKSGKVLTEVDFTQDIYTEKGDTVHSTLKESWTPPSFPNQDSFIAQSINYPTRALDTGRSGVVYVRLEIDEEGNVLKVRVVKSADAELDYEAFRVMSLKKKWTSAKDENGKAVKCLYTVHINFSLG